MNKGVDLLNGVWSVLDADEYCDVLTIKVVQKTITPKAQFKAMFSQCYILADDEEDAETFFFMIYSDNEIFLRKLKEKKLILDKLFDASIWFDGIDYTATTVTSNTVTDSGTTGTTGLISNNTVDKLVFDSNVSTINNVNDTVGTTTKNKNLTSNNNNVKNTVQTATKSGSTDGTVFDEEKNSSYLKLTDGADIPANTLTQTILNDTNQQSNIGIVALFGDVDGKTTTKNTLIGDVLTKNKQDVENKVATVSSSNTNLNNLNTLKGNVVYSYNQKSSNTSEDYRAILCLEMTQLRREFWGKFGAMFTMYI